VLEVSFGRGLQPGSDSGFPFSRKVQGKSAEGKAVVCFSLFFRAPAVGRGTRVVLPSGMLPLRPKLTGQKL